MSAFNGFYRKLLGTEVRFVKLCPAAWDEPIECEIIYLLIELAPDYVALSYAWGDNKHSAEITVNGFAIQVTSNFVRRATAAARLSFESI
jgi:hypothetical protein